jgi:hypothetical protein
MKWARTSTVYRNSALLIASGRKAAVASGDIIAILGTSCRLGKTAY